MSLRDRRWYRLLSACVVVACGGTSSYVYAPEGANLASGSIETRVRIPPEEPHGEVRVASLGLTTLDAGDQRGIRAVQIRLTVSNNSDDTPWKLDTRQQLLEIPREGRSVPMFANSDRDSFPVIQLARTEQRTIDLFFPLPSTVKDEDDLASFELLWRVTTGTRLVAERTPFQRLDLGPEPDVTTSIYAGWGPYWFYDPSYPRYGFTHHRPIIVGQAPRVVVTGRPRGHYVVRPRRG